MEKVRQIRHRTAIVFAAACAALAPKLPAATLSVTWDSSTGDWFDPTQWTPGIVPNNDATDTYLASIPAGTVTLSASATVSALSTALGSLVTLNPGQELDVTENAQLDGEAYLNAGSTLNLASGAAISGAADGASIDGPGVLDLSGSSTFFSGNMSGSGVAQVLAGATLTLDGGADLGRPFVNDGLMNVPTTAEVTLLLQNGASLTNNGTLTLLYANDAILASGGGSLTGSVVNTGVMVAGNSMIVAPLSNSGTITANAGSLSLFGGGTSTGVFTTNNSSSIMSFGLPPAYGIITLPEPPILLDNATLSGPGIFTGSITIAHQLTVSNAFFQSVTGPGTLVVAGSLSVWGTPPATATFASATIQDLPGAIFTATPPSGSSTASTTLTLNASTLTNQGTAVNLGQQLINLEGGSVLLNSGVFNTQQMVTVSGDGDPANAFINTGTLNLGQFAAGVPFFNTGTVAITRAATTITLSSGGTASGLFAWVQGTLPSPPVGALIFSSPYTFSGASLVPVPTNRNQIPSTTYVPAEHFVVQAPATILGNVSASGLTIQAGLDGGGTLTGSGNLWSGGTISGTTVVVAGSLAIGPTPGYIPSSNLGIGFGGTKALDASTLIISPADSTGWQQSGAASDTIGLKDGSQIQNYGSFQVALGSESIVPLDNNPSNTFYNQGSLSFFSNLVGTLSFGVPFINFGTVTTQNGTIEFDAPFTQNAGALSTSGGTITGSNLTLLGGSIAGNIAAPVTLSNTITLTGPTRLNSIPTFTTTSTALDLANNPLIVEATDPTDKSTKIAALRALLQSAQSGPAGPWTGPGITSSAVAADAAAQSAHTYHTTLALADNASLQVPFTSFAGFPVDTNSLLVTRALVADGNLDNTVNNADLVILLTHFGLNNQTQTGGDFTDDGTVDNADLVALLTNYGQSLPAGDSLEPASSVSTLVNSVTTPVPEPPALSMLALLLPAIFTAQGACRTLPACTLSSITSKDPLDCP